MLTPPYNHAALHLGMDRARLTNPLRGQAMSTRYMLCLFGIIQIVLGLPSGFHMTQTTGDLNAPMHIHLGPFEASGRALVVEKAIGILIVDLYGNSFAKQTYLPMQSLHTQDETGCISVTTDPDWDQGQTWVYVYWAKSGSQSGMRISRFWHSENNGGLSSRAAFGSQELLWRDPAGFGISPMWHYGGKLSWGPDEKLYLGLGDKYTSSNAEDRDKYEGCILRINKDGTVPSGNLPISTKPAECWAHGFRNPFRPFWDIQSNRFYVASVGGNDGSVSAEGLYLAEAGKHYGWPHCEGQCDNPDFRFTCDCDLHESPIYTYPRNNEGACIIGGEVLRMGGWPTAYHGAYFFADYTRGTIKYLKHIGTSVSVTTFHTNLDWIVSLEADSSGNLWVTRFENWASGSIHKISYSGANTAPVINFVAASVTNGPPPLTVSFTNAVSDATNHVSTLSLYWDFGDGSGHQQISAGQTVSHVYTDSGDYTAILHVSDGQSSINSNGISIQVGEPPIATLLSPISPSGEDITFRAGDVISLVGAASHLQTPLTGTSVQWHLEFIHDDHFHPLSTNPFGVSTTWVVPSSGHSFEGHTGLQFSFTATEPSGLSTTVTGTAWPEKVDIVIDTVPSGGFFTVDSHTIAGPHTMNTMIGFEHVVSAAKSQCFENQHYNLAGWPRTLDGYESRFVVPSTDSSFLIQYIATGQPCRSHIPTASLKLRLDAEGIITIPATYSPTAIPTSLPTVFSPTALPTSLPTTIEPTTPEPTEAPSEPPSPVELCSDIPEPWMVENGKTCSSFGYIFTHRCNAPQSMNEYRDWWVSNKWCQQSCFDNGVGYDGDTCTSLPGAPQLLIPVTVSPPIHASSCSANAVSCSVHHTCPTGQYCSVGSCCKSCNDCTTTDSFNGVCPPRCTTRHRRQSTCTDIAEPWMVDNGLTCDGFLFYIVPNRCNSAFSVNPYRTWWVSNKWCQQTCYDNGNGYEGDTCDFDAPTMQPSQEPTMQPSQEPTMQPSSEPTSLPSQEPTMLTSPAPSPGEPTSVPSRAPTFTPSEPTAMPTQEPTSPAPVDAPTLNVAPPPPPAVGWKDLSGERLHLYDNVGDVTIVEAVDSPLEASGNGWFGREAFYGKFLRFPTANPSSLGGGHGGVLASLPGPWTVFAVVQFPEGSSGHFLRLADVADGFYVELDVPPSVSGGWSVYAAVHLADGTLSEFVNGQLLRTTMLSTPSLPADHTFMPIRIMSPTVQSSTTTSMDIASLLLYSLAMSAEDRIELEDYLIGEYFSVPKPKSGLLPYSATLESVTAYSDANPTAFCPGNKIVHSVTFASFGNPAGGSGGPTPTSLSSSSVGSCHSTDSIAKVSRTCLGQSSCTPGSGTMDFPAAEDCTSDQIYTFQHVGVGCCRDENGGTGDTSRIVHNGIGTMDECQQLCVATPGCTGVERTINGVCEVHTMVIHHDNGNGFCDCFRYVANPAVSRLAFEVSCATPLPGIVLPLDSANTVLATSPDDNAEQSSTHSVQSTSQVLAVALVSTVLVAIVGIITQYRKGFINKPTHFEPEEELEWDDHTLIAEPTP